MSTIGKLRRELAAQGIPVVGIVEGNPPTVDYAPDATAEQRTQGDAIAASFTATPDPDWQALKVAFITPGNALYESVRDKMAASNCLKCSDQFQNLKMLIIDQTLWNTGALAIAITNLSASLTTASQPLSAQDVADWNALITTNDFPANCLLS